VRTWRSNLVDRGVGAVTVAKSYRLLRTVLGTAVEDRLIRVNPCQIRGASVERSSERPTLEVNQVFALAEAMPARYRLLVLLATFCSMRWGELAALTRQDLDVVGGWVHIRRGLVEMGDGSLIVGPPKTAAGRRVVAIPANLLPSVAKHLTDFVDASPRSFVFAGPKGGPLRRSNFQKHWRAGAATMAVPGLHFHDLRHYADGHVMCPVVVGRRAAKGFAVSLSA
jgi:integrase